MDGIYHSKRIIGAWLAGSAVIAFALVCLPLSTAPSSANATIAQRYSFHANPSNAALKGDRLDRAGVRTKDGDKTRVTAPSPSVNASGHTGANPVHRQPQPASTSDRKNPLGCETALSKLVAYGLPNARCVTSIGPASRLAMSYVDGDI